MRGGWGAAGAAGAGDAAGGGYREPPEAIQKIVTRPPQPQLAFAPGRARCLVRTQREALPPVAELARKELKLAGMRLDPTQNSPSKLGGSVHLDLADTPDGRPWGTSPSHPLLPPKDGWTGGGSSANADGSGPTASSSSPAAEFFRGGRITGYPKGMLVNYASFNESGDFLVFTLRSDGEPGSPPRGPLELWGCHCSDRVARPLLPANVRLNGVFQTYAWVDDDTVLALTLPPDRPDSAPVEPASPPGPRVETNASGSVAQNRTYADLLKSPHDAYLLEYYGTSLPLLVEGLRGPGGPRVREMANLPPRLYTSVSASPDGQFLVASHVRKPFSFAVPLGRFPKRSELMRVDGAGDPVTLVDLPLAESIPIAHGSCREGRRSLQWRSDAAAQIMWVESLDGGNGAAEGFGPEAKPRDAVFLATCEALLAGDAPRKILECGLRFAGVGWAYDSLALGYEYWYESRRELWYTFDPSWGTRPGEEGLPPRRVLFDRNSDDAYTDPGSPVSVRNEWGNQVMAVLDAASMEGVRELFPDSPESCAGGMLLMEGDGATPDGNIPFLDAFSLETGKSARIWESRPPKHEGLASWVYNADTDGATQHPAPLPADGLQMLMTRETQQDPPQFHLLSWEGGLASPPAERLMSNFPHPHPELTGMGKEVLRYKRIDGVDLTATLYTPPGYDLERDGRLPCILWAYPKEYNSREMAGQMRRSPNTFTAVGGYSPLLWLSQGYAVVQGATMPIIGENDEKPNDTYVEQLVDSAEAVVKKVVDMGVVDAGAVAVGGHSYGAFMTANLLIHAPHLFCCGIAQSGAYNRTLTPWGFQSEDRSYWEAPGVYSKMSPFQNADRVSKPILLIHGEEDNNAGTLTMQSERLFSALRGHGVESRLVLLPHESHGYMARESVLHVLNETGEWLEQHCRPAMGGPRAARVNLRGPVPAKL